MPPPSRRALLAAQPAVWAGVGLTWGLVEAVAADRQHGDDPWTVLAVHALALAAAGVALAWWPLVGDRRRGLSRTAGLLVAGAVALPAAVYASQTWVRGAPTVSLPNLGIGLGAGLLGLMVARLLRPLLRSAEKRLLRPAARGMSAPRRGLRTGLRVVLPLLLLGACAWRAVEVLTPPTPGPWFGPEARGGHRDARQRHLDELRQVGYAGFSSSNSPSVLLITLDTLRADHLSAYGYPRPTSPRLDALPGVRFERAYAQAHWTAPSTASLLTGLYPSTHGTNDWVVSERRLPQYRLFPSTLGRVAMKLLDDLSRADDLNAWALPFLESVGDKPFFLYLHYKDPHHPYEPPGAEFSRFDPEFERGVDGRVILDPSIRSQWPISERELANMRARYDGEIRFLDEQLGVLFDELRRRGRDDDTIIVVTSDHGEEFLDHGGWIHGDTVYEEMIRVPLFIHDPRMPLEAQVGLPWPVRLVDVVPTLLDLLQIPGAERLPGRSLAPLMVQRAERLEQIPAREAPFHEVPRPVLSEGTRSGLVTLIEGDWKLIRHTAPGPDGAVTHALYELARDPTEQSDLATLHPERVTQMSRRLDELLAPLQESRLAPDERHLSPADLEALRQLGYVK